MTIPARARPESAFANAFCLQRTAGLRKQIPQPGQIGEFVDSFELRFFPAQASVINEV